MTNVRCVNCGLEILIDSTIKSYHGELGCSHCNTKMTLDLDNKNVTIVRRYPTYDELRKIWPHLSELEKVAIWEASQSIGVGAYTASESMSLKTLESLLRRRYETKETLGRLLDKLENDEKLSDLHGIITYFKNVRNRVTHPDKISSQLEAENTFTSTKRLLIDIVQRIV